MDEHRTEVDGWFTVWLIVRYAPRIMLVHKTADIQPLVSSESLAAAPDLVQMRERFPRLEQLWDAVQHEYWAELFPSPRRTRGQFIT